MSNEYQMEHVQGLRCPDCKETREILKDAQHALIYCRKCGLVLYEI